MDCGRCSVRVETTLDCGHVKTVYCYDCSGDRKPSIKCTVDVMTEFSSCGHQAPMPCYSRYDTQVLCPLPCGVTLACGDVCSGSCGHCAMFGHAVCKVPCKRVLFCGHECGMVCHSGETCQPCESKCTNRCFHSKCPLKCSGVCSSCAEPCVWSCPHEGVCPLPCCAPCSRLPCNRRCENKLSCGHQCPSLCGELCPPATYCQVCGSIDKNNSIVDYVEMRPYSASDVDTYKTAL